MRKITLIFVLSIVVCSIHASNPEKPTDIKSNSTINGTVCDKLSGEPLAGAEVKLMNSDVKIYTNLDGQFEIKDVQPGAHAIVINYISYQNTVENIFTESGNTATVTVKLNNVEK